MNYFNQETERLQFRKLTKADIPAWTAFFVDNDLLKYVGIDMTKSAETNARKWIEKQFERYETQGLGHLAVEIKATKTFIGVGGILPRALENGTEYEIAYSLIPKFWKNGYGTEIAQQMKAYGFEHLTANRFVSIIAKNNTASINVAQKNGMKILWEMQYLGLDVFVFGIEKIGIGIGY